MPSRSRITFVLLVATVMLCQVVAEKSQSVANLSPSQIEEELQQCSLVQALNEHKLATSPQTSSITSRIFAVLFPGSPAINALLATLYISGPPNFALALCPANIDPSSLTVMVAFAVGGILGDTVRTQSPNLLRNIQGAPLTVTSNNKLFHLLPEIFLGEASSEHVRFVMLEPNKNLLLGVAIMVGFITFVAMDKALRITTGGDGGHDHSHSYSNGQLLGGEEIAALAKTSGADSKDSGLRQRKGGAAASQDRVKVPSPSGNDEKEINASVKLGGYLNLIADFTHNITDGLAMASSFYASPTLGATTAVAVCFHELPHEVGDFALLIQSGFTKRQAIGAQFITAIGAFLGTFMGIAVQEYGGSSSGASASTEPGLWGTSLQWGDMLLPFTAGTFLYVGTVAVIPELLETGSNKSFELRKTAQQFVAIAAGAGIMLYISWS